MDRLKSIVLLLAGIVVSVALVPDAHCAWVRDGAPLNQPTTTYKPFILPDGSNGSIVAWYGGAGSDIFAQRLLADGTIALGWPTDGPLKVCEATGLQELPVLVSDQAGGALMFWQDARNLGNYDIYGQHIDASGQVYGIGTNNWAVGGTSIAGAAGNQYAPAAVSDNAGGAIVVWQDGRNGAGNYDIYAQRVDKDGYRLWAPAGVPVCTAPGSNQINPTIVADGAGGAFIAWQDYRKGTEFDIYMQHLNASGAIVTGRWVADGLGICVAANSQFYPTLASDGAGGAFVAWQDFRSGTDNHIFAQRVGGDGTIPSTWPVNGTPVCQAQYSQYYPVVVGDGSGGAFIAWQDYRTGVTNHIFAQHLTAQNVGLVADGIPVSLAPSGQFAPQIASDGQHGAFVTWYDSRSGSTNDIYVQRVDLQGRLNPAWDSNGQPVCIATNTQQFPVVTASTPGNAILTWQDLRSGGLTTAAIFAAQAATSQVTGVGGEDAAIEPALGAPHPNPSRGEARIQVSLTRASEVRAEVLDLSGRRVATLASETFSAGTHALLWDGRVAGGGQAPPGVYLVRVKWDGNEMSRRVVRLR